MTFCATEATAPPALCAADETASPALPAPSAAASLTASAFAFGPFALDTRFAVLFRPFDEGFRFAVLELPFEDDRELVLALPFCEVVVFFFAELAGFLRDVLDVLFDRLFVA